jgi:fumarate hydratase class I
VRRCVIDAVQKAQGLACAAGTVGVGIGGDRAGSALEAGAQLLRELDDRNPDPALAALEDELRAALDQLRIGPMGLGGRTTVLGVKIGGSAREPSGSFVSVSYLCWANRRGTLVVGAGGR